MDDEARLRRAQRVAEREIGEDRLLGPLVGCVQLALALGHRERQGRALATVPDEPPPPPSPTAPLMAIVDGGNLHAGVVAHAGDCAAPSGSCDTCSGRL